MKAPLIAALAAAASLASATAAVPAAAQARQVSIEHRDLNLSTPEGQSILEQRINKAARAVCAGNQPTTGTRLRSSEAAECYRTAKAQAKTQVAAAIAAQQRGG